MWKFRIVNDALYGSFYLPKVAWIIIDTPEFQRLKKIKQTGNTHFVYPAAEHSRFQHCLGVAHLAEQLGNKLHHEYPQFVTEKDRLLLCLAGLCHDLGHTAYSHLYDNYIVPVFDPNAHFKHEHASYYLLDRIFQRLQPEFEANGITFEDIILIAKMILGSPEKVPSNHPELAWTEKDRSREYIFQVVANASTGIDVDKFDYLARDCLFTGVKMKFDSKRLMEFAVLTEVNNQISLTYESDSAKELIASMWDARNDLHRRVYQHRVVKTVDTMVCEVILRSGDMVIHNDISLRNAHKYMSVYIELDDTLLDKIKESTTDPYTYNLITRIQTRDFWKTVATVTSTEMLHGLELIEQIYGMKCIRSDFSRDAHRYHILNNTGIDPSPSMIIWLKHLAGNNIHVSFK